MLPQCNIHHDGNGTPEIDVPLISTELAGKLFFKYRSEAGLDKLLLFVIEKCIDRPLDFCITNN